MEKREIKKKIKNGNLEKNQKWEFRKKQKLEKNKKWEVKKKNLK